jgi:hypothetical protein
VLPVVGPGLLDLFAGIHHERAILANGFAERTAGHENEPGSLVCASDANGFAVSENGKLVTG